jgi:arsenate reductase-like glutaredoxin family protein
VKTAEEVDARKERYGAQEALGLLSEVSTLYVAKGKKVTRVNLKKDRPDDDTLVALMLGPTGNLRAPTMKVGKTLLIGFNDEIFEEVFG